MRKRMVLSVAMGLTLVAALLALAGTARAASVAGITINSVSGTSSSYGGDVGWEFTTSQAITITHLGIFDANQNGVLNNSASANVYLWSTASGTKLAEVLVPNTTTIENGFFYAALGTPVALSAGTYRVVSYANLGEPYVNNGAWTTAPDITLVKGYAAGTHGSYPTSGGSTAQYFGAGFKYALPAGAGGTYTWSSGTSGDWTDLSWTGGTSGHDYPQSGDSAYINTSGATVNVNNDTGNQTAYSFEVNQGGISIASGRQLTIEGWAAVNSGGSLTVDGTLSMAGKGLAIAAGGFLTTSGTINAGSFSTSGANTFSGGTRINVSNATIGSAATLASDAQINVASGGTATIGGAVIAQNGSQFVAPTITISNGGSLTMQTGSTMGGTTMTALTVTSGGAFTTQSGTTIPTITTLTLNSGGTLNLGGTMTVGSLDLKSGGTFISGASNDLTVSTALTVGTDMNMNGGTLSASAATITVNTTKTLTLSQNLSVNSLIVNGTVVPGAGTSLTIGTGNLSLGPSSTATMNMTGASLVATGRNVTIANNSALTLDNAVSLNQLILTNGNVYKATNGSITSTNTSTTSGSMAYELSLGIVAIGLGGTNAALNKLTSSTVTLSGTNTYGGKTRLVLGNLIAAVGVGLPDSSLIDLAGAASAPGYLLSRGTLSGAIGTRITWANGTGSLAAQGGVLTVNLNSGATLTWDSGSFLTFATDKKLYLGSTLADNYVDFQNKIALGSTARTLSVSKGSAAYDAVLSGGIEGSAALTKEGNGTLRLSAANSGYSGVITVTAGTLLVADQAALGTGANTIASGGTLAYSGGGTFSKPLSLSGNGYGSTGAFRVTSGTATLSSAVTLTAAAALGADANATLALSDSATLTGNYTITKVGAGTMTLGATNQLPTASTLAVNAGTFDLNGFSQTVSTVITLAGGSIVATGGGTLITTNATAASITVQSGTLAAAFVSSGGLTKNGSGTVLLTGPGSYSGATTISAGVLQGTEGTNIQNNILFNANNAAAVFQIGTGSFTRGLGAGAGQVQWTGTNASGGFAAVTQDLTVNLGGNPTPSGVTWNSGSFCIGILSFGSTTATNLVDFQNPINLNNNVRTIRVDDNAATTGDFARLSGVISSSTASSGKITKTGAGTLELLPTVGGTSNTYTGETTIQGGVLRAAMGSGVSNSSLLTLDGGVFESSGTLTRSLGAAAGNVRWGLSNSGGFSAKGGTLTVKINNSSTSQMQWTAASFVQAGKALLLGSTSADSMVEFQNPINLYDNGAAVVREFNVADNANTNGDYTKITGALTTGTAANAGILKSGAGTLELAPTNGGAANTYGGTTKIAGGVLRAVDGAGLPSASQLEISGGVFESSGTFTRALSSSLTGNNIRFTGSGGFSAQGGNLTVNLDTSGVGTHLPVSYTYLPGTVSGDVVGEAGNYVDTGHAELADGVTFYTSNDLGYNDATSPYYAGFRVAAGFCLEPGPGFIFSMPGPSALNQIKIAYFTYPTGGIASPKSVEISYSTDGITYTAPTTYTGFLTTGSGVEHTLINDIAISQTANYVKLQFNRNGEWTFLTEIGFYGGGTPPEAGQIVWGGTESFLALGQALLLNSTSATDMVDFQNKIALGGAVREVNVADNPSVTTDYAKLSGIISNGAGTGGLLKTGAGLLELSAANSYTGATTVSAGTLKITGSILGTVTVNSGARLAGAGHVNNAIVSGIVAPGNSPGTLLVDGDYTMNNAAIYEWELGATAHDLIDITGNLALNSTWVLQLQDAGGSALFGSQFNLFTYDGSITSFGSWSIDASLVSGLGWNTGGATIVNDPLHKRVYLTGIIVNHGTGIPSDTLSGGAVPEPAALGLLGIAWLVLKRRKVLQAREV